MKTRHILIIIFLLSSWFAPNTLQAQHHFMFPSKRTVPILTPATLDTLLDKIPKFVYTPAKDNRQLQEDDITTSFYTGNEGSSGETNFKLENEIDVLPNALKIDIDSAYLYLYRIQSVGACFMSLKFSKFDLPRGSTFFMYNEKMSNKPEGENYLPECEFEMSRNFLQKKYFSGNSSIPGTSIVMEYFEPKEVQSNGNIRVKSINHGYTNPYWVTLHFSDELKEKLDLKKKKNQEKLEKDGDECVYRSAFCAGEDFENLWKGNIAINKLSPKLDASGNEIPNETTYYFKGSAFLFNNAACKNGSTSFFVLTAAHLYKDVAAGEEITEDRFYFFREFINCVDIIGPNLTNVCEGFPKPKTHIKYNDYENENIFMVWKDENKDVALLCFNKNRLIFPLI